jgi:hypothetical protein
MPYKVIITGEFSQKVNGILVYFKCNTTYDLVEAYREVLEDGVINTYHAATVNSTEVNLPEDYTTIIDEVDVPEYENEVDKYLATMVDTTEDYLTAYRDRLRIEVNPFADVDRDSWIDPRDEEREDPE